MTLFKKNTGNIHSTALNNQIPITLDDEHISERERRARGRSELENYTDWMCLTPPKSASRMLLVGGRRSGSLDAAWLN